MTDEEYYSIEKDVEEYEKTGDEALVCLFVNDISPASLSQRNRTEAHYKDLRKLYDRYDKAKGKWENERVLAIDFAKTLASFTGLDVLALQCKKLEEQLNDCKEAQKEPQQQECEEQECEDNSEILIRKFRPKRTLGLGKLYNFLIADGLVIGRTFEEFTSMIMKADFSEMWSVKKSRAKVGYLIYKLKSLFIGEWENAACKSVNCQKKKIQAGRNANNVFKKNVNEALQYKKDTEYS